MLYRCACLVAMLPPTPMQHAGLQQQDVEYHEINEAFAVVALVNMKVLGHVSSSDSECSYLD